MKIFKGGRIKGSQKITNLRYKGPKGNCNNLLFMISIGTRSSTVHEAATDPTQRLTLLTVTFRYHTTTIQPRVMNPLNP